MLIPVGQAEQEHALAESRKHAAAAQAHSEAELAAVCAKLAAATEQVEQQRRSHAASLEEERQAAKSKESLMQVIIPFSCVAHPEGREQALHDAADAIRATHDAEAFVSGSDAD